MTGKEQRTNIIIRVDKDTHHKLKVSTAVNNTTIQGIMEKLIKEYLEEDGKKQKE